MGNLATPVNEALTRVLVERNVTLIDQDDPPIKTGEPGAIVSGLPFVRIDAGRDRYRGRRRQLTVVSRGHSVKLLARSRPLPDEPREGWLLVESARDRLGRLVPLCAVDGSSARIHSLIELSTATVIEAVPGRDPIEPIAETFIGTPLSILLRHAPPTQVGQDVPRLVRALLEKRPVEQRRALEGELSMLQNFAPAAALPRALARRLGALKRALSDRPERRVPDSQVEREVARLTKLTDSRAVAALRLGRDRIEGLINPGPLNEEWRLRPMMFRLQLGYSPLHPILQTWSPLRPAPGRGHGHCLGEAQPVLHDMDCEGDLFSLVDTVINFRETNHIRALPLVDPEPRGRRLADMLASLF